MMTTLMVAALALATPAVANKQDGPVPAASQVDPRGAELIALSKQKWSWMAEKNVDALARLFHDEAIFVHMSRTMTKPEELQVIRSGNIEYRRADIKDISVRFIGDTAIVASRIDLHAIVGGRWQTTRFRLPKPMSRLAIAGSWARWHFRGDRFLTNRALQHAPLSDRLAFSQ